MIGWLKRYGMIVGLVAASLTGTGAIIASASSVVSYVDEYISSQVEVKLDKVQFAMSQKVQEDLKSVQRGLRGVQEQVNSGASDNRIIKEKIEQLDRQQKNSDASIEKQLNLIIKLIDKP